MEQATSAIMGAAETLGEIAPAVGLGAAGLVVDPVAGVLALASSLLERVQQSSQCKEDFMKLAQYVEKLCVFVREAHDKLTAETHASKKFVEDVTGALKEAEDLLEECSKFGHVQTFLKSDQILRRLKDITFKLKRQLEILQTEMNLTTLNLTERQMAQLQQLSAEMSTSHYTMCDTLSRQKAEFDRKLAHLEARNEELIRTVIDTMDARDRKEKSQEKLEQELLAELEDLRQRNWQHQQDKEADEDYTMQSILYLLSFVDQTPDSYLCPITKRLMQNPVFLLETWFTYEHDAIIQHLSNSLTDPETGNPLLLVPTPLSSLSQLLRPNVQLREQIRKWRDKGREGARWGGRGPLSRHTTEPPHPNPTPLLTPTTSARPPYSVPPVPAIPLHTSSPLQQSLLSTQLASMPSPLQHSLLSTQLTSMPSPQQQPAATPHHHSLPPAVLHQPHAAVHPAVLQQPHAAVHPALPQQPHAAVHPAVLQQPHAAVQPALPQQPHAAVHPAISLPQPHVAAHPAVLQQPHAAVHPAVLQQPHAAIQRQYDVPALPSVQSASAATSQPGLGVASAMHPGPSLAEAVSVPVNSHSGQPPYGYPTPLSGTPPVGSTALAQGTYDLRTHPRPPVHPSHPVHPLFSTHVNGAGALVPNNVVSCPGPANPALGFELLVPVSACTEPLFADGPQSSSYPCICHGTNSGQLQQNFNAGGQLQQDRTEGGKFHQHYPNTGHDLYQNPYSNGQLQQNPTVGGQLQQNPIGGGQLQQNSIGGGQFHQNPYQNPHSSGQHHLATNCTAEAFPGHTPELHHHPAGQLASPSQTPTPVPPLPPSGPPLNPPTPPASPPQMALYKHRIHTKPLHSPNPPQQHGTMNSTSRHTSKLSHVELPTQTLEDRQRSHDLASVFTTAEPYAHASISPAPTRWPVGPDILSSSANTQGHGEPTQLQLDTHMAAVKHSSHAVIRQLYSESSSAASELSPHRPAQPVPSYEVSAPLAIMESAETESLSSFQAQSSPSPSPPTTHLLDRVPHLSPSLCSSFASIADPMWQGLAVGSVHAGAASAPASCISDNEAALYSSRGAQGGVQHRRSSQEDTSTAQAVMTSVHMPSTRSAESTATAAPPTEGVNRPSVSTLLVWLLSSSVEDQKKALGHCGMLLTDSVDCATSQPSLSMDCKAVLGQLDHHIVSCLGSDSITVHQSAAEVLSMWTHCLDDGDLTRLYNSTDLLHHLYHHISNPGSYPLLPHISLLTNLLLHPSILHLMCRESRHNLPGALCSFLVFFAFSDGATLGNTRLEELHSMLSLWARLTGETEFVLALLGELGVDVFIKQLAQLLELLDVYSGRGEREERLVAATVALLQLLASWVRQHDFVATKLSRCWEGMPGTLWSHPCPAVCTAALSLRLAFHESQGLTTTPAILPHTSQTPDLLHDPQSDLLVGVSQPDDTQTIAHTSLPHTSPIPHPLHDHQPDVLMGSSHPDDAQSIAHTILAHNTQPITHAILPHSPATPDLLSDPYPDPLICSAHREATNMLAIPSHIPAAANSLPHGQHKLLEGTSHLKATDIETPTAPCVSEVEHDLETPTAPCVREVALEVITRTNSSPQDTYHEQCEQDDMSTPPSQERSGVTANGLASASGRERRASSEEILFSDGERETSPERVSSSGREQQLSSGGLSSSGREHEQSPEHVSSVEREQQESSENVSSSDREQQTPSEREQQTSSGRVQHTSSGREQHTSSGREQHTSSGRKQHTSSEDERTTSRGDGNHDAGGRGGSSGTGVRESSAGSLGGHHRSCSEDAGQASGQKMEKTSSGGWLWSLVSPRKSRKEHSQSVAKSTSKSLMKCMQPGVVRHRRRATTSSSQLMNSGANETGDGPPRAT